ncbi:MAG: hypothetical protein AB7V42_03840 [Thermoleophilia bacterium]
MRAYGGIWACAAGLAIAAGAGGAAGKVGPLPAVVTPAGPWAATSDGRLVRLDPATGAVRARSARLGYPFSIAADGVRVWVADGRGDRLLRLSGEGAIEARRHLPGFASGVGVGGSSAWVLVHPPGARSGYELLRVDRGSLAIRGRFHLGRRFAALAVSEDRVWLAIDPDRRRPGMLIALDERRGTVVLRRREKAGIRALAADPATVTFLTGGSRPRIVRVGATGRPLWARGAPANAGLVAAAAGRVWVGTICGGATCRLDRASVTPTVIGTARSRAGRPAPGAPATVGWRGGRSCSRRV